MTYTAAQIDAAIEAEARAWADFFMIFENREAEIEGRRMVMRANVSQNYFAPLLEFLPTDREGEWDEALRMSEEDARKEAEFELASERAYYTRAEYDAEAQAEMDMMPEYRR
jgi:hypothetical protein